MSNVSFYYRLLWIYFVCLPLHESFVLPARTTTTRTSHGFGTLSGSAATLLAPRHASRTSSHSTHNDTATSSFTQPKSKSSSSSSSSSSQGPVLFQKIVRDNAASSDSNDLEFLGSLVAWLQDGWELPNNLPMTYKKQIHDDNSHHDDESLSSSSSSSSSPTTVEAVITWNSALSPLPDATDLHVNVVAIVPDKDDNQRNSQGSIMAMVVLSKAPNSKHAWQSLPVILQNLFADAEKRIVQALDRALMDWQGTIATTTTTTSRASKNNDSPAVQKWNQAKQDMLTEFMEEMPMSKQQPQQQFKKEESSSPILDAEIVDTTAAPRTKTTDGDGDNSKQNSNEQPPLPQMPEASSTSDTDFAVQAARRLVQQQKEEDFAVRAARRVVRQKQWQQGETQRQPQQVFDAESKKVKPSSPPLQTTPPFSPQPTASHQDQSTVVDPRAWRLPCLSQEVLGARSFAQTISRPQDYAKRRQRKTQKEPTKATTTEVSTNQQTMSSQSKVTPQNESKATEATTAPAKQENVQNPVPDTINRKVNIVSEETMDPNEEERLRMANQVMNEMADATGDLSPEEMLQAVMKFGDDQKKEETVGQAFVSGAFEKAKELLKEQHEKREERLRQRVTTKVVEDFPSIRPNIKFEDDSEQETAPLSAEEELRRMFQAGEKLADSRISTVQPQHSPGPASAEDEKLIDELVESNKEVSSHARVLDDELVELEMRINKSPDELTDGPRQNPVFDVFSGPELYNPNVDPETAVNWPGALPDTKTNLRLPKELDEAVKQARFAANVLSKVEEKEKEDGTKLYFAGDRQLTEEQVNSMRTVVREAAGLGLISDPLEIMAERSRLKMIIDELWNQPGERFRDIVSEYKDLLLSDHFVGLVKERLREMADRDIDALRQDDTSLEQQHEREREILGGLVAYAQLLLKEARALGAELEAQQLEVIRSICKVAMDPSLKTEEETANALSDAVRDMRPLFDDAFVAYLKYAVAEEEARLARASVLDDPDHAQWLYVLKIVQQGVYKEISRGISRYIDHIWYILRMETAKERRMLLSEIVDALPTLDVRPFVQVVGNIAGALGDSARGEFDGSVPLGEMTNKILQLHRDVHELLPPERIAVMSRDADEWAKRQKEKLLEQRNLTKQRLKAARETEHLEDEIEALGRMGESERFD